ncbi:hypothetical protein [Paenibacillus sp. GYB003]|uniref:hypothetical protein n=1 Tax=Paenibacillus sp. GYB003 TaxID=2994392 RepID=UPI002F963976
MNQEEGKEQKFPDRIRIVLESDRITVCYFETGGCKNGNGIAEFAQTLEKAVHNAASDRHGGGKLLQSRCAARGRGGKSGESGREL